jgi:hypothetical protein
LDRERQNNSGTFACQAKTQEKLVGCLISLAAGLQNRRAVSESRQGHDHVALDLRYVFEIGSGTKKGDSGIHPDPLIQLAGFMLYIWCRRRGSRAKALAKAGFEPQSELIPRSLILDQLSRDAAGLASESRNGRIPFGRSSLHLAAGSFNRSRHICITCRYHGFSSNFSRLSPTPGFFNT